MGRDNILGMVCGYYLSRFDHSAYQHLGLPTQKATHEALGKALGIPAASVKNWRDEFDPVHDNPRRGWHRRGMYPSRLRVIEALGGLTEGELSSLVRAIVASPGGANAEEIVAAIAGADVPGAGAGGTYRLRGPTGVLAERAFMEFHRLRQEPAPGTLLDRRHDECGFDFEIRSGPSRVLIEVKGLAGETGGVTLTDKEWTTAREEGDRYFLAVVRNVATEPAVTLLQSPGTLLDPRMRTYTTIQVAWSVSHAALYAAGRPAPSGSPLSATGPSEEGP